VPPVSREVRPCQKPGYVLNEHAVLEAVPAGWALLPPGDAALSRRIKSDGPSWTMSEKKGDERFPAAFGPPPTASPPSAPELLAERADPAYERKLTAARQRRAVEQADYVEDFRASVLTFLAFHPTHAADAALLATLIAAHATPVGSGTVARTERIPIEERAEAATHIASAPSPDDRLRLDAHPAHRGPPSRSPPHARATFPTTPPSLPRRPPRRSASLPSPNRPAPRSARPAATCRSHPSVALLVQTLCPMLTRNTLPTRRHFLGTAAAALAAATLPPRLVAAETTPPKPTAPRNAFTYRFAIGDIEAYSISDANMVLREGLDLMWPVESPPRHARRPRRPR